MKPVTCCFTGHRKLSIKKANDIVNRLNDEIDKLIQKGVTNFLSGGALGFDQIAASLIISKRERGHNISLIFILPCRNQDEHWSNEQKHLFHALLNVADEVRYLSEEYDSRCMKRRNYYMVDNSAYCICALLHGMSGTAQTVNYAREQGLHIINVAE